MRVRFELKPREMGKAMKVIANVAAVSIAILVSALIFLTCGVSPGYALKVIFGSLKSSYGLSEIITKMIPLLIVSTGLVLVFKMRIWNIGSEGQILAGAIAATWVVLFCPINIPEWALLPVMFLIGFIAGAFWALIPAVLRAKFQVNEIITSLMLVYVAMNITNYLIYGPWKGKQEWGFPYTDKFPASGRLPTLFQTRITWPTLMVAILSAFLIYFFLERMTRGFEMRFGVGKVADYAWIDVKWNIILAMIISGGLSGIAGVDQVAGIHHRLRYATSISANYGFSGIIVALLGKLNPLACILSAFLLAMLFVGGDAIQVTLGLPFAIVNLFNGLVLMSVILIDVFTKYSIKVRWEK